MNGFGGTFWEITGVVLAVLAIIVTVIVYFLQRKTKRLSYEILQNTLIISYTEDVKEKLTIFYEGKPVNKVSLLEVNITNSGNTPILPIDYQENLDLSFNKEAEILSAEVIHSIPENLNVEVEIQESHLKILPSLLNPEDSFNLKLIVNEVSEFHLTARIIGIKEITFQIDHPPLGLKNVLISFIFIMLYFLLSILQPLQIEMNSALSKLLAITALLLVYLPIFTNKEYLKRWIDPIRKLFK